MCNCCLIHRLPISESGAVFTVNGLEALTLVKVILQVVSAADEDFGLKVGPATCTEGYVLHFILLKDFKHKCYRKYKVCWIINT